MIDINIITNLSAKSGFNKKFEKSGTYEALVSWRNYLGFL